MCSIGRPAVKDTVFAEEAIHISSCSIVSLPEFESRFNSRSFHTREHVLWRYREPPIKLKHTRMVRWGLETFV